MAAALLLSVSFTSCDELGLFDDDNEAADDQAFFPKAYKGKDIAAWYSMSEEEKGGGKRIEAVFLFEDNSFVVTKNKSYPDDRKNARTITAEGEYRFIEGDYDNGVAEVTVNEEPEPMTMSVEIEDGVMRAMGQEFIKQNNKKLPKASDPTGDGDNGEGGGGQGGEDEGGEGQGGEGQGGEGQGGEGGEVQYNGDPAPYLPAQYAEKTIAAWYQYDNVGNGTVRYECVFLFTDGSLVVTKSKFYNIGDGREPEYDINATGQYRMSEGGDFENGTATVILADGMSFEVLIEDGTLFAMETEFTKQDNKDAPAPIKK